MDIVRDRPLLGVRDADYAWAEHDVQHMIRTVAHIAHILCRLLLESGDARGSIQAATRGLAADSGSDVLPGDALEAEISSNDPASVALVRQSPAEAMRWAEL